ncbi:MFS transporter [Flindersiella endophytica]
MRHFTGNSRVVVGVLCVAQFVVVLDVTVVATALPAIGGDLGFAAARVTWVITAYTVALAGLLILGGRIADLIGAGRAFRAGLMLFGAASMVCAVASTPGTIVAARVAQGAGAALLSPAALAALSEHLGDAARRVALGWWTAAGAVGGGSGWVLGGLLTELAGWRWVFAVNLPVAVVAFLVSRRLLGNGRPPRSGPLDVAGAVWITLAIGAGTLGLSRLAEDVTGWTGWAAVVLAAVALAGFVRVERRARAPLVPGGLIRTPGVVGGNLTAAALTGSTTPAMLAVVLYVQDTLRLPPLRGAVLFPAFNLAVIGGSLLAPSVLERAGERGALVAGFCGVLAGIGTLLTLPASGLPAMTLLGAFSLLGAGLGTASVASTTVGSIEVTAAERGVAAGLLNSTAQLGTALGLAVATPLVASAAPMTGYRLGFVAAAAIAVAGLVSVRTIRTRSPVTCTGRRCPS